MTYKEEVEKLTQELNGAITRLEQLESAPDAHELLAEINNLNTFARSIQGQIREALDQLKSGMTKEAKDKLDDAFERTAALSTRFSALESKVTAIQSTVDNHDERIAALEQNLKFGFDVEWAIQMSGYTDEEFRRIFGFNVDDELLLESVVAAVATQINNLARAVVHTANRVSEVQANVDNLGTRFDHLATDQIALREEIQDSQFGQSTPPWWAIVASVAVGLLVWAWVNNSLTAVSGWVEFGIGLSSGILALALIWIVSDFLGSREVSSDPEEETNPEETDNDSPATPTGSDNSETDNPGGSSASDDLTAPVLATAST